MASPQAGCCRITSIRSSGAVTADPSGSATCWRSMSTICIAKTSSGRWSFDHAQMKIFTDLFLKVGRPVVINLRANHFVGEDPLVEELISHESSFARLNDDSRVEEIYYHNAVFAPTFALDEKIPLNRYRFGGFRRPSVAGGIRPPESRHPPCRHAGGRGASLSFRTRRPRRRGNFGAPGRPTTHPIRCAIPEVDETPVRLNGRLNQRFGTPFRSGKKSAPALGFSRRKRRASLVARIPMPTADYRFSAGRHRR